MPTKRCAGLLALLSLLVFGIAIRSEAAAGEPLYTISQRFGVCVAPVFAGAPDFPGSISDFAGVEELGFGWYSDWRIDGNPETLNGTIEYAQLLPTRSWPPNWAKLEVVARARPASLWIIGNEPETRGQGEHTPAEYADIYHQAYHFIKGVDPQAQIAIGGVVMPTPLRLKWLDQCLDYYEATYGETMPIDVWNIHVQILQEKRGGWGCGIPSGLEEDEGRTYEIIDNCNAGAFQLLIIEFCTWLAERGERDKPVIITEYGVLMPSSYLPEGDQSVLGFMEGTFDFMLNTRDPVLGYAADENRLVQRWLWFSLNFPFYEETPGGYNSALCHWQRPDELTVFGEFYRDYIRRQKTPFRLYVPALYRPSPSPTVPSNGPGRTRSVR